MNGDAAGAVLERIRNPQLAVNVIKFSWRERLGRWIAGIRPRPIVHVDTVTSNLSDQYEVVEKKAAANNIEGGMRFRIVNATNGKVLAYQGEYAGESALRANRIGEQFYVIKEGESLLDALAVCLALDRVKQS